MKHTIANYSLPINAKTEYERFFFQLIVAQTVFDVNN